jgi:hypothetical protein
MNENDLKCKCKIRRIRVYRTSVVHRTALLSEMRRNTLTEKERERNEKSKNADQYSYMDR